MFTSVRPVRELLFSFELNLTLIVAGVVQSKHEENEKKDVSIKNMFGKNKTTHQNENEQINLKHAAYPLLFHQ